MITKIKPIDLNCIINNISDLSMELYIIQPFAIQFGEITKNKWRRLDLNQLIGDMLCHFNKVYFADVCVPDCPVGLYETCSLVDFNSALVEKCNSKFDGVVGQFIS